MKTKHCDCFVDDGETAEGTIFNGFCPLHAAAPELLEILQEMNNGVHEKGWGWADLSVHFIKRIPDLIAKATAQ